jgi:hypothetical protein
MRCAFRAALFLYHVELTTSAPSVALAGFISIVIFRFSCIAMIRKVGKILANTFHAGATPRTELD